MEHTFRCARIRCSRRRTAVFPAADLKEIVAYAKNYHVEIVPQQQTFGHLHKVLKYEKYNELAEVPYGDVLSPQEADSYKFVGDLFAEINEIFPSEFLHIGADETFELGEGQKPRRGEGKRRRQGLFQPRQTRPRLVKAV